MWWSYDCVGELRGGGGHGMVYRSSLVGPVDSVFTACLLCLGGVLTAPTSSGAGRAWRGGSPLVGPFFVWCSPSSLIPVRLISSSHI